MIPRATAPITLGTLSCGIRLVTEAMPDVRSVAVGFWVGTGSRDEPDELAGASHFLEHLLFKGTERRSAAAIAESLDEVGGDCNAFTTKDHTGFYIRLLAEDLDLGLDILSDIMWEPALREVDVDSERMVILDEILMHADEAADLSAERWQAALFPGHSLGRDTLGTAQSVKGITAKEIGAFFEEHYRPANMVVSVAGDISHDEVVAGLERRLTGREGGIAPARLGPTRPIEPLVVVNRPTEQAHLVLGARSVSRFDEDRWALAVLNHVLGGGLSSRLFQKVREERGLAYSIWSDRSAYDDTGSLAVSVGTAPEHVGEVLRIVHGEFELLANDGVTARELKIAKGNLRADALLAGEDSLARMSRLGSALLLHREIRSVEEIIERIGAVDASEVQRVAGDLASAPKVLSVVGPFKTRDFDESTLTLA